jgi:hypothetical protein
MDINNYVHWLKTQLIPNLLPNFILITENASYHNMLRDKLPTSNSSKAEMKTWLMDLAGHEDSILRLPHQHPQLNPIDLTWVKIKLCAKGKNTTFKVQNVQLCHQKFTHT